MQMIVYNDQLKRLKNNIISFITADRESLGKEGGRRVSVADYRALTVDAPRAGYRFTDLNYGERIGANWDIAKVMNRLSNLADLIYLGEGDEEGALDLIVGHFRDFIAEKYVSTNWYHNDLGIPSIVNRIMILVEDLLPKDVRDGLIVYIGNGSLVVHPEIVEVKNAYHSGANLTNYCNVSIHHGLFTMNEDEIARAVAAVEEETYGGHEGLQPDGSFFQHGRRLYSFGYGTGYIGDITRVLYYIEGTRFDFSRAGKENLLRHVLDGVRYMVGGAGYDYSPSGRSYTRTASLRSASLLPNLRRLCALQNMPRVDELVSFCEAIKAGKQPVFGVKYFDVARFLTLHTENLYVSFRGAGRGIRTSEICTFENYMGVNLSYGTNTCVMRSGKEYHDISGIWDYSAIPGTTARAEDDETIIAYPDFTKYEVDTEDFGGAQLDDVGVCFIGGENYGVKATKCAFATPFGMIILGAGISEREGRAVRTTVEQSIASGETVISCGGTEVLHGGVLYKNLTPTSPFTVSVEHRESPTERNGRRIAPYHVEGKVFSISIPHSKVGESYGYIITEVELRDEARRVEIIENTEAIQAVRLPDGRTVAVFHKPAVLNCGGIDYKGEAGEIKVLGRE